MKILHVLISPRAEGTPRLVLDWLAEEAYEQHVLFLEAEPADLITFFPEEQKSVNDKLLKGYKKIGQIKRLVEQTCREYRPDIVISWSTGLSQWVLWGAKKAGVKQLIAHCGNAPGTTFVGKYLYSYLSFWINACLGSKIVCCSEYIKKQYCDIFAVPSSRFYAVYNCVSTRRFQKKNVTSSNGMVVMVATLEAHKDHLTLLDAWKIVEESQQNSKLVLVGKGSLETYLKSYAQDLGLKNIEFCGTRNDVPDLLVKSDMFVFSTTPNEGFGTVLVEALAVGLPIIATDVPACREVLCDGKYGKLVPFKDSNALAKEIEAQLNTKETSALIEARSAYASNFTAKRMIEQYIAIANEK